MKKSRISLFKKIAVCLLMTFLIPISGLTTSPALATAPSPTVIPCGGSAGTPHFSEGGHRKGNWEIHAQAHNWCNSLPNELALGGIMFRSSWRGWIEEPHVGKSKNPSVVRNKTKSSPHKFVLVVACEPHTWYRWMVRFGNSASVNGKPMGNANPIMVRETTDEIVCAPKQSALT